MPATLTIHCVSRHSFIRPAAQRSMQASPSSDFPSHPDVPLTYSAVRLWPNCAFSRPGQS